jgi:hypothetical protein
MGIFVVIKPVPNRELSNGEHQPIGRLGPGELIGIRGYLLDRAIKIEGLADESAWQAQIRDGGADLIGFSVWETGDPVRG